MRKNILFCLVLLSNYAYCQDCSEFQTRIDDLTREKGELLRKLNSEEIAYEQLDLKYQKEVNERIMYQNKYFIELGKRKKSEKKLNQLEEDIENLRIERDSLSKKIQRLDKLKQTNSDLYTKALAEKRSLNKKIEDAKKDREDYKNNFETEQEYTKSLEKIIKKLEDEADDRISFRDRIVVFKNKEYNYGDEIIFIPCYNGLSKLDINDENEYLLERLSKLVSKYDYRVKISFVSKSVLDEQAHRRALTSQRISNVKSKMIADYNLKNSNFETGRSNIEGTNGQAGISIQITRR